MRFLVTGGAGFMGSNFMRYVLNKNINCSIVNLDKLTYAGNLDNLKDIEEKSNYKFVKGDILDQKLVDRLMQKADAVFHFAAESHVTRSEIKPDVFYKTNVEGTKVLLESAERNKVKKFIHISTDEVYGSRNKGFFKEEDKKLGDQQATSDYAKSKSKADDLALSFKGKLDIIVVRSTNNFGPYQYPEKALPRWITRVLSNEPVPVWGNGEQVRDWLYVIDTARAILQIFKKGKSGEAYNVAANNKPEIKNIDVANIVCKVLKVGKERFIKFIPDPREHHDFRYALDITKIKKEVGWVPSEDTKGLIKETVLWYKDNPWWWKPLITKAEEIYKDIE
jgi:dTDP-glucose 4,6-dehydratase